ncbi:MAG TPA: hypothetical protein VFC46_02095 [Humisphaera sp.]|nr:hypothetical protein [Humisphaera sp.]
MRSRSSNSCLYGAAIAILLASAFLHAGVTEREKQEYQKIIDQESSQGPEINDEVFQCIPLDPYRVEWIYPPHRKDDEVIIRIMLDGKAIYSWKGHVHSTFAVFSDQLIYAKYEEHAPGCRVIAVDLKTGHVKWESPLGSPVGKSVSSYWNRVRVRWDGDRLYVFGEESDGRYIDAMDLESGQSVAHRILPPLRRAPVAPGTTGVDAAGVATVSGTEGFLAYTSDWDGNSVILARVVSITELTPGAERLTSHTAVLEPLMKLAGGADCSTKPRIKVRLWIDSETSSIHNAPIVGSKVLAVVTHGYISGVESNSCFWVGPDRYAFMPGSAALVEVSGADDKAVAQTIANIRKCDTDYDPSAEPATR